MGNTTAPIAREYIDAAQLSDKIEVKEGDFFLDAFPSQVDLVFFSNILHDWPEETNMMLLHKAYDSLSDGGRIVISEMLLENDVKSSTSSATNEYYYVALHKRKAISSERVI